MHHYNRTTTIVLRSTQPLYPTDTPGNWHNRIPALRDLEGPFRYRIAGYGATGNNEIPQIFQCDLGLTQQVDVEGGLPVIGVTQRSNVSTNYFPWIYCDDRASSDIVNFRTRSLDGNISSAVIAVVLLEVERLHN